LLGECRELVQVGRAVGIEADLLGLDCECAEELERVGSANVELFGQSCR